MQSEDALFNFISKCAKRLISMCSRDSAFPPVFLCSLQRSLCPCFIFFPNEKTPPKSHFLPLCNHFHPQQHGLLLTFIFKTSLHFPFWCVRACRLYLWYCTQKVLANSDTAAVHSQDRASLTPVTWKYPHTDMWRLLFRTKTRTREASGRFFACVSL